MAGPKKRKVSSPVRMPVSAGPLATNAIENFFEEEEIEMLLNRGSSFDDEEDLYRGGGIVDDLEAELFDAIEEFEDFDLN